MSTPVKTVAAYIIANSEAPVSNLKLQKLLYYVQGWHFGFYQAPAFEGRIEAWIHGPVVPEIFRAYREFKWNTIPKNNQPVMLDTELSKHIEEVLGAYGGFSAVQLEMLSHREDPWLEARQGLDAKARSQKLISPASMQSFFGKLANGQA